MTIRCGSEPTVQEHALEYEMVVELGKIREFAVAVQADSPEYRGVAPVIPPTFLTTCVLWRPAGLEPDAGFELSRSLHGEQEYVFYGGLPRAGQRLRVSESVVDTYEKRGRRGGLMRFAVIEARFSDEDGTVIARARATVLEREPETGGGRS